MGSQVSPTFPGSPLQPPAGSHHHLCEHLLPAPQRVYFLSEEVAELGKDAPNPFQKSVLLPLSIGVGVRPPHTCWTPLSLLHGESDLWDL